MSAPMLTVSRGGAYERPAVPANVPGLTRGVHWAEYPVHGRVYFLTDASGTRLGDAQWEADWSSRSECIVFLADEQRRLDPHLRLLRPTPSRRRRTSPAGHTTGGAAVLSRGRHS